MTGAWIGTSGWSYDHWHPELYPSGLAPRSRLGCYSAAFPTAELNSSFYRWPAPAAFHGWRDRLPDGFRLSVKAPRGLTHARKLYAPETWLQRIREGWHELGDKRAVLLVQLPPSQARDDARLAYFLRLVPDWIRVAVEFRHHSWHCEATFALLAEHRTAYCVMSGANLPCVLRATTDFVYVRMHGPDHHHLYAGSYPGADLTWWADRIREWSLAGKDVYVYFNNDGDANAVRNARTLQAHVTVKSPLRDDAPPTGAGKDERHGGEPRPDAAAWARGPPPSEGGTMTDAPPTTVEDMFVQTASGVRTDGGTMTLLGLTPHTIYFSDRPQRIVGHLTTHRFLQWWSEGDDSFAADPPNAVLAWGEPGTDTPEEAVVVISDPSITADGLQYHVQTLQGTPPATAGPCVLFIDPLGRPLSPVSVAGVRRRELRRDRRRL